MTPHHRSFPCSTTEKNTHTTTLCHCFFSHLWVRDRQIGITSPWLFCNYSIRMFLSSFLWGPCKCFRKPFQVSVSHQCRCVLTSPFVRDDTVVCLHQGGRWCQKCEQIRVLRRWHSVLKGQILENWGPMTSAGKKNGLLSTVCAAVADETQVGCRWTENQF